MPVIFNSMREGDGNTLLEVGAMGASAAWAVPTLVGAGISSVAAGAGAGGT